MTFVCLSDKAGNLDSLHLISATAQSGKDALKVLGRSARFAQRHHPIHHLGKAQLLLAKRRKTAAACYLLQNEVTGKDALDVEPRIFDVRDQVIPELRRVVLRPGL